MPWIPDYNQNNVQFVAPSDLESLDGFQIICNPSSGQGGLVCVAGGEPDEVVTFVSCGEGLLQAGSRNVPEGTCGVVQLYPEEALPDPPRCKRDAPGLGVMRC